MADPNASRRTKTMSVAGGAGTLDWRGDKVLEQVVKAALAGADETLEAAAEHARSNHGWESQTGTAEESIQAQPAEMQGATVTGQFGSYGDDAYYFIFLETGKAGRAGDDTLRRAADAEFLRLAERIRVHVGD